MMNIIGRRKLWYTISTIAIVPGLLSLIFFGLKLGIDFKGGSQELVQGTTINQTVVTNLAKHEGFEDVSIVTDGVNRWEISFFDPAPAAQQEAHHQAFKTELATQGLAELSFNNVGPSVSQTLIENALLALALASAAIVIYIAFAFRNVPPPASSWNFGLAAIAALLHDAFFVLGIFSILGHFWGVEVDSLFVTAILTVIGFSVHDTIVVFDRIRENLRRYGSRMPFEDTVNLSLNETMVRSLGTSLTVLFTLLALYLFGGTTIRTFILALLIGIASGTYSSIFNASPLLVSWQLHKRKKLARQKATGKS